LALNEAQIESQRQGFNTKNLEGESSTNEEGEGLRKSWKVSSLNSQNDGRFEEERKGEARVSMSQVEIELMESQ